ncbi:hypothetical protein BRC81_04135 [Halobacteriales archaeon QS_1_68_20]|nr:MAG: hypothetical protein BRC81_04135 [Halobacteriales archaeon QS_1_68_20]
MFDTPALDGFDGQTRRDLALVAFGGVLACLAGYVGTVALLYGDLSALSGDARSPRRVAAAGASVVCWTYYALAFVRARGGPVLDALVYPLLTVGVVPMLLRWSLFGVSGLFPGLSLEPLVLAVLAVVPGVGWFSVLLAAWSSRLDDHQRRRWERRHLTTAFRTSFVEDDRD